MTEPSPEETPGMGLAVLAESLYLSNLLLLPGLSFLAIALLYLRNKDTGPALAVCHLRQTFWVSLWGGTALIVVNLIILVAGGYGGAYTWMWVILYFTVFHTTLVMFGILGLAKAMAGKNYRYPLIGVSCDG